VDECHLCWGDVCGYVWGKTNIRIEILIENERKKQTYYGALNYQSKEFVLKDYETGNSENTVDFMKYLQAEYKDKRIVLIWDGATYHKSHYVKDFLASENHGKDRVEWPFTCILFAPHSPEQNPVEDVWLHGKSGLRSIWHLLASFPVVKYLFEFCLNYQKFDFHKIQWYLPCSALY
jgi:transposase